jgi:4-oxalocrotonate tautomerase
MSGHLPDVPRAIRLHDGRYRIGPDRENMMFLIQVELISGVFMAPQKRAMIERLTDAVVAIEGESMREATWCLVEEVSSGDCGIGGQTPTADDVRALARSDHEPS